MRLSKHLKVGLTLSLYIPSTSIVVGLEQQLVERYEALVIYDDSCGGFGSVSARQPSFSLHIYKNHSVSTIGFVILPYTRLL